MEWPPNYTAEFQRRQERLHRIRKNLNLARGAFEYYRTRPAEFIADWCITYDPRNGSNGLPKMMPFIPFEKQVDLVEFLQYCVKHQVSGLIEKSRDMGATWICAAFSVHAWIYGDGAIGWGSRKEQLVDRLGDPSSIFEKIRLIVDYLPAFFLPDGYNRKEHATYMKMLNPKTGASITGEAGDNIGRGGRKSLYFKDESAHYERPQLIEAALGDNTNVQIDISSVHGTNNVFYRRRQSGQLWDKNREPDKSKTQIFIMDWRDHPAKDQEWYDKRRAKAASEGLLAQFAQEVDRDYASAVEGIIIPPAWVKSAIDAHKKLGIEPSGATIAGQDIADEGGDKNALAIRKGILLTYADHWGEGDTGATARKSIMQCRARHVTSLQYDSIGVGAGFKAETNRLRTEKLLPPNMDIVAWAAGASPLHPKRHIIPGDRQSPKNADFYANIKAQAWWNLRLRFELTHKAVTTGVVDDPDELISIDGDLPLLHEIVNELSQPTYSTNGSGKLIINKKPDGGRSPNLADAIVMAYWPITKAKFMA